MVELNTAAATETSVGVVKQLQRKQQQEVNVLEIGSLLLRATKCIPYYKFQLTAKTSGPENVCLTIFYITDGTQNIFIHFENSNHSF